MEDMRRMYANFVLKGKGRRQPVARVVPEVEWEPVKFVRERLGIEPDETQVRVLESRTRYGILNCTRQWGKSTVTAAKVVHRAYLRPEQTVLVASPTGRQSWEFLKKAAEMVRRLGLRVGRDPGNPLSVVLPNGSRIIGVPDCEDTVRGFTADMLVIDEAARVTDELFYALTPMLAVKGGDLWLLSTPIERRGFFFETWDSGGDKWEKFRVTAPECARIPAEFLQDERERLGKAEFANDYMAEFLDAGSGLFDRDLVEAAMDPGLRVVEMGFRKLKPARG